ncbi:MAG: hypothetical protein HUJ98_12905, partial [Bacteroidaceae bacterium]|nr:hypothetical protein [Bacteroidaceae bacterium]
MKKNLTYILAFAGLAAMTSCQKDDINGGNGTGTPGGNITISCGLDQTRSRAQYADNDWLQIEWQMNDNVKVFCAETQGKSGEEFVPKTVGTYKVSTLVPTEYKVTTANAGEKTVSNNNAAKLTAVDGLYWNKAAHTFYAAFGDATVVPTTGVATFTYKANQTCTLTPNQGEQTYIDRSQLNLVATTSVEAPVDNLTLPFRPIMTALEIEVKGISSTATKGDAIKVTSVVLQNLSETTRWYGLNGTQQKFKYDIVNSTFAIEGTETQGESVTLMLKDGDNDYVTVAKGGSIRVTAILPPVAINANELRIKVNAEGEAMAVATLKDPIAASKKAICKLPNWKEPTVTPPDDGGPVKDGDLEDMEKDVNKWQSYLPDDAYVASVTMPGTAHSGATKNSGINWASINNNTALVQPYSVLAQLAQGVRVLEFFPVGLANGTYFEGEGKDFSWEYYSDALYSAVWSTKEVTGSAGSGGSGDVKKRDNMVFRLA